jgi:DNA-binding transcriptional LysR family regulator
MLSWDDFRYVKAIAEARSLAGAGEHLGVNHSTVFRRLGQIEQHLGSRLFERGRAGYALTPCGTEMVHLAERMFQEIVGFGGGWEAGLSKSVRSQTPTHTLYQRATKVGTSARFWSPASTRFPSRTAQSADASLAEVVLSP